MRSLTDKTISAVFWSLLQKFGAQGLFIVVNIILVRLLTPEDFGLIGMLAIFISVSQVLVNGGFSTALIQKKDTNEEDYSSVFYINFLVSIIIYLLLFFFSPLIADFYKQPSLVPLTRLLSLIFVFNSLAYVQETRLRKEMRFKTIMSINLPSIIIGGIVSISMAYLGFGVWSLVAMQVLTSLIYMIQLWIYLKWRPLLKFNFKRVRGLFLFGGKVALSDLIHFIYLNIYPLILGKFFPLSSVGYYQAANKFAMAPGVTSAAAIYNATFPAFTSIQDNDKRLKDAYRRSVRQLFFGICPIFIFLIIYATQLFNLIFTDKWLLAVPYFRWLCITGLFVSLNWYSLQFVNVKGKSSLFLKLGITEKALFSLGIIISIPFGITALLALQAINAIIIYFVNNYYSARLINYTLYEHIADMGPILLVSIMCGGLLLLLNLELHNFNNLIRVMAGLLVGGGSYYCSARYFKLLPFLELNKIFKQKIEERFI